METYIHNIQLSGKDDFSKRFNYVGWLWQRANDQTLTEDQQQFYMNEHFNSKLALEQGMPISFLNEYENDSNQQKQSQ